MNEKQKTSNPALTKGKTPENLVPPIEKGQNNKRALNTEQANRKDIKVLNNGTVEETAYSNSNVENYLGSEKLNEKMSKRGK